MPMPSPARYAAARALRRFSAAACDAGASATSRLVAELPVLPPCDFVPAPYSGPSLEHVMSLRRAHMTPSAFHYYAKPLMLVEGRGAFVFDETGRRYLDGFGGIVTTLLGHGHPRVLAAVREQQATLAHTTLVYAHPQAALYCSELVRALPQPTLRPERLTPGGRALSQAATLPPPLSVVFLVNSGSEASDLALSLVRAATGRFDVVALRGGYHGLGAGAGGLSGTGSWKQPSPGGFGVHHVASPDAYRGVHGSDGPAYAADISELVETSTSGGSAALAGFFAESTLGVGGVVPLAPGFLAAAYGVVRASGGLCVADEVQSGFGRTGAHFWGFQSHGVLPDVVTMAKGIGNGFPLDAVVTTRAVAAALTPRLWCAPPALPADPRSSLLTAGYTVFVPSLFLFLGFPPISQFLPPLTCLSRPSRRLNTFGGGPVASAAGRAVLQSLAEEGLQANAAAVGAHLMTRLKALQDKHSLIGDVRGSGLLIGVELVTDRSTKAAAGPAAARLLERARELGLLLGKGGRKGNVLRVTPPLCVTMADADFVADVINACLCDA